MASFHGRSNSFPSQSHPIINDIENHLERLKASQAASTSSICSNLASLRDLHDSINNMIQMPSIQQALVSEHGQNWLNELLEGSMRLVDLCGFARDVLQLTKESVQELESSIRRQAADVSGYVASRKRANKMIEKRIKGLKISNQKASPLPDVGKMLKEVESLDISILKYVLIVLSGQNKENSSKKSWSNLLSKLTETRREQFEMEQESEAEELYALNIHKSAKGMDSKTMLKQLKASETSIQEIEDWLEALFRSVVKTRVSLLNVHSH